MITNRLSSLNTMRPRDPHQPHRVASPLELFFDLVFVVAVSFSSQGLHHMEADGQVAAGLLGYFMVFFAIWWAWMNFTWFATSFDNDDWLYRAMTVLQMAGALIVAAGSTKALEEHDFALVTIGYVIMRLALVAQWIRAGLHNRDLRRTTFRYAAAISAVQIAWVVRLFLPEGVGFVCFFVLVVAEVAVPMWAERHGTTPWHAHHLTERYGSFTLILLGESILASATAIVDTLGSGHHLVEMLAISAAGLIIAAGMWWIYFSREQHHHIKTLKSSLVFGYFHYLIFAAAGAFSAGIEVTVDSVTGEAHLQHIVSALTLTGPVAVFIIGIWWLTLRHTLTSKASSLVLTGVALILAGSLLPGIFPVFIGALGVAVAVIATEMPSPEGGRDSAKIEKSSNSAP
ncbi:low temperature requirement protein A [Kocuria massiliensis]|uniref:low temperature requirement protein A n=1 Tax=Kocuria massiliensis TaxID=1926282 RepID=UPI001FE9246D|nr:low temperature requirement protein A [Kocuria massiliensis]